MNRQPHSGRAAAPRNSGDSVRVRTSEIVPDELSEEMKKVASEVAKIAERLDEEQKIEFTSIANRCRMLAESVSQWLSQDLSNQVYWIEASSNFGKRRLDLVSANRGRADAASAPVRQNTDRRHD